MSKKQYNLNVFINVPYDDEYTKLQKAIIFTVIDCGFIPRIVSELSDAGEPRTRKLYTMIGECRLAIHDISRIELNAVTQFPHFNMPFELGIFLGAKLYGDKEQQKKAFLILEREPYRYQKFISDLSGQDIWAHKDDPETTIVIVRDWLTNYTKEIIPSGSLIWKKYEKFNRKLPNLCKELRLDQNHVTFRDYVNLVISWLRQSSVIK